VISQEIKENQCDPFGNRFDSYRDRFIDLQQYEVSGKGGRRLVASCIT